MKKTLCITLTLCILSSLLCLVPSLVFAESSGVCGAPDETGSLGSNLTWSITDGTLTISGTGAMADFTSGNIPWKDSYSTITSVVVEDGVTSIGDNAFNYHTSLTSVTLGKDITAIGTGAFDYCSKINALYISDLAAFCKISLESDKSNPFGPASTSFLGDSAKNLYLKGAIVKDLVLPTGIPIISKYKFAHCSGLESVTIPTGVTAIDAYAFQDCKNLKTVTLSDTVTTLGNYAFSNCSSLSSIALAAGVSSLGYNVFEKTTALTAFEVSPFNPNYYDIDGHLFDKNHTLIQYALGSPATTYTLPVTTKKVQSNAFRGTTNLTHLVIPEGITNISDSAFRDCTSLTNLTLPNTLTKIENHAFYGCSKLTEVVIPDSVTSLGTSTFNGCKKLERAVLSKSLTSLPYGLFSGCENLVTAMIPEQVTEIDSYAFYNCKKLKQLLIPDKVKRIGLYTFYNCQALTDVTMPATVELIDFRAFEGMTNLSDVYYEGCKEEWDLITKDATNSSLNAATIHYNCNADPLRHRIPKQVYDKDTKTLTVTIVIRNNASPAKESCSLLGLYNAAGSLKAIFNKDWGTLGTDSTGVISFTIENYTPVQGDYLKLFLWKNPAFPMPWLPAADAAVNI